MFRRYSYVGTRLGYHKKVLLSVGTYGSSFWGHRAEWVWDTNHLRQIFLFVLYVKMAPTLRMHMKPKIGQITAKTVTQT